MEEYPSQKNKEDSEYYWYAILHQYTPEANIRENQKNMLREATYNIELYIEKMTDKLHGTYEEYLYGDYYFDYN